VPTSQKEQIMVQVREAVQKAQSYLPEVFPESTGNDLLLEGVELTEDYKFWAITFSYHSKRRNEALNTLREYKTVKLRAKDGKFIGARNGLL